MLVGNGTRRLHIQGVPSSVSRSNQCGAKDVQSSEDTAGRSVHNFRDKHWGPCAETPVCFLLIILVVFTVEIAALKMKTNSDVKFMKNTLSTFTR
jgi:hypothetical protein